jgi:outer membrane protein
VQLERPAGEPLVVGLDEAAATALRDNPEINAAVQTVEKARAGARGARAEYIPDVGVFAQYIYQNGVPLLSQNNAVVGLQLKWTALDFGKRHAALRVSQTQLAEAEENLERLRSRVQIDVEKSARKVRRAETAVAAARDSVAARQESLRVASDQVEAGTANRSALIEAEAALASSQADLLQAEFGHCSATAEVRRIMGAI